MESLLKNYSICRIASLGYLQARSLAAGILDHPGATYGEMLDRLSREFLVYSFGLTRSLKQRGHAVREIMSDCEILQKQWARENGFRFSEDNWSFEICLEQLRRDPPEILFLQDSPDWARGGVAELREKIPQIRRVVTHSGFPRNPGDMKPMDLILSATPGIDRRYRGFGLPSTLFYHYFDEQVLQAAPPADFGRRKYPLTFAGSSGYGFGGGHLTRYLALDLVFTHYPAIGFLEEEAFSRRRPFLRRIFSRSKPDPNKRFTPVGLAEKHRRKMRKPVYGLEFYRVLGETRLGLNIHTDAVYQEVGNIRMFQMAGMGTLGLVNHGDNLGDLFVEGEEVLAFRNLGDLFAKLDVIQSDPARMEQMARNGQRKCLANHTAAVRAVQLEEILHQSFARS